MDIFDPLTGYIGCKDVDADNIYGRVGQAIKYNILGNFKNTVHAEVTCFFQSKEQCK